MHDDRLDLSPLDSLADPARMEALVAAIAAGAAPELARRAAGGGGLLAVLGTWAWPTLAAASLAAVLSAAALLSGRNGPAGVQANGPALTGPVVTALQLADPVAAWLDGNRGPTTADLVLALEREGR